MYGATYRNRVRRIWLGPARNTVLSPLSIIEPDAYTRRSRTERRVFTPGDPLCLTDAVSEQTVRCAYHTTEVSRGHSSQ